jgi:hypothetical protein
MILGGGLENRTRRIDLTGKIKKGRKRHGRNASDERTDQPDG